MHACWLHYRMAVLDVFRSYLCSRTHWVNVLLIKSLGALRNCLSLPSVMISRFSSGALCTPPPRGQYAIISALMLLRNVFFSSTSLPFDNGRTAAI